LLEPVQDGDDLDLADGGQRLAVKLSTWRVRGSRVSTEPSS
jgi:hypothetical protein